MARHAHQVDKQVHFDPSDVDVRYPDHPTTEPGLVGGPSTAAIPGIDTGPRTVTDDGGEITLAGQSREKEGERPPANASAKDKQER